MTATRARNQDEWVSCRAPSVLVEQIRQASEKTGVSQAEVVRSALIAAFFPGLYTGAANVSGVIAGRNKSTGAEMQRGALEA